MSQLNIDQESFLTQQTGPNLAPGGYIRVCSRTLGQVGMILDHGEPPESCAREHVFEKQALRRCIGYMIDGVTPAGTPLGAGKAPRQVLNKRGIWGKPWPTKPEGIWGDTPSMSAFGILGHEDGSPDRDNLQLLHDTERTNNIKDYIMRGFRGIGEAKWKGAPPEGKVTLLAQLANTFAYMAMDVVTESWNSSYKKLLKLWNVFAEHPDAIPPYDYAAAFEEVARSDLEKQVSVNRDLFRRYAEEARAIWSRDDVGPNIAAETVQQVRVILNDFVENADSLIMYDIEAMLAKD